jgi:transcriptional regulator with XRE-family HTH domain
MSTSIQQAETSLEEDWVPTDSFSGRLSQIRHELKLSQADAAERCGLAGPTWSTWENGASPRNMAKVVEAIHDGLGVNRAWLMWGAAGQNWKYFDTLRALPTNPDPVAKQMKLPRTGARHLVAVPD